MEVPLIYVNDKHTTRDLYGAVSELNESNKRVIDKYIVLVKDADDLTVGVNSEPMLRRIMSDDFLPSKFKKSWNRDEERVFDVLKHELRFRKMSLRKVDLQLEEMLQQVDAFTTVYAALVYLRCAYERISFLSTDRARERLGLIGLAAYNFAESRIIRHAQRGVYLTRPEFN